MYRCQHNNWIIVCHFLTYILSIIVINIKKKKKNIYFLILKCQRAENVCVGSLLSSLSEPFNHKWRYQALVAPVSITQSLIRISSRARLLLIGIGWLWQLNGAIGGVCNWTVSSLQLLFYNQHLGKRKGVERRLSLICYGYLQVSGSRCICVACV